MTEPIATDAPQMGDSMDPNEFPTDAAQMGDEASIVLDDLEDHVNALIIIAGIDPLAVNSRGVPLYTEAQRSLIIDAASTVSGWRE